MNLFKIASLVNLILFFISSSKRSLAERLLKIKLTRIDPTQRRYVDFTYINRLIVWTALGQSLSSLLPFLDISKIKGMFAMSQKLTQFITLDEKDINSDGWCGICGAV
jgi:Pex2 / Pex12 amino terminal region